MALTLVHPIAPGDERTATDSLAHLALAAGKGDHDATRTVVASITPSLIQVVRGVVGPSHSDVEDIVQEAVIAFVHALPTFRGECTVLHFACRIAMLHGLMFRRRAKSRVQTVSTDVDDGEHRLDPSSGESVFAARRRELLRTLCDELPESQVEALAMHCILGFTVEEIAAASDVPVNTVRSRLRLAKEALRSRVYSDPRLIDELGIEQ